MPDDEDEVDFASLSVDELRLFTGVLVTPDELAAMRSATMALAAAESASFGAQLVGLPTSVDWRSNGGNFVTPIKNQGQCGSCVSFCTCATIESAIRIKQGNPGLAIDLSEGFCQFCGGGSCGGWGLTSGLDFAKSTGITDEACMPYTAGGGTNMNCTAARCSDWANRLTKINGYTPQASTAARKNAVATIGPVLAGMEVWSDFGATKTEVYWKKATATRANPPAYHCICVIGYDDAQQCWIIKNSWGSSWGDGGFCRIGYGQADILIDSSWPFYSVDLTVGPGWLSNVIVSQVYASSGSQNAWAYLAGYGWRRINPGAPDGVINMLGILTKAVAYGRKVNCTADASYLYSAYLL